MPTKLPLDIPKSEGRQGEDPRIHVMNFHLWFSSKNIIDDTVHLRLFQHNLIGPTTKWYIGETSGSHAIFDCLAMDFITFFQLLICQNLGFELLTHFKKITTTHISYLTHEWLKQRILYKAHIEEKLLLNLFLRSLISEISKDVASSYPKNDGEVIYKARQFELIYMQSRYLYHVLLYSSRLLYFRSELPGESSFTYDLIRTIAHNQPRNT